MNKKVISIFLAVIMVMSVLPLFLTTKQQPTTDSTTNYDAPGFESIPGAHVNHKFNSIADGLDMIPKNATSAQYIDVSKISGTPLEAVVANSIYPDTVYNANITKTFFADYSADSTWIELHTISPEVVAFSYFLNPTSYNGYQLLVRDNGIYNVIGTPLIFGSKDKVENTIDVISGSSERSDKFDHVLSYADMNSEFQRVTVNSAFASQYYLDFKRLDNVEYSRTVVYLDAVNNTLENLARFEANSTERGVVYDITTYGNITKVIITGNFYIIANEPVE